ncbi:MAG: sulfatase [Pseudomonadota bacterium]
MTLTGPGRFGRLAQLATATVVLHLILIQPNHPDAVSWRALLLFPLELPPILLGLLALGTSGLGRAFRIFLTVSLTVLFVLKGADFISFSALSRGFNPVTDLSLVDAFIRLLTGSLGLALTVLMAVLAAVAMALVMLLCWWSTGIWARAWQNRTVARIAVPAAILALVPAIAEIGNAMSAWDLPFRPPGAAFTARVAVERVQLIRSTVAELREFRAAAANDPFNDALPQFGGIDRDVLILFVESYGRTSFDTPFYAALHRGTLDRYGAAFSDLGLSARSGFLTSPTSGGQSWLTHATFANGLWVTNQVSYAAVLSSGRKTLYHHAADAGFRTATVMPQITLDWPEADRMGFEEILVAADLGYRGLPMNWVTMPDQFTLSALDRLLRNGADERRLFAQVVLVSSHAPWVPVPTVLPWEDVGDGSVYNTVATSGDTPEAVWRDHDRVRHQYRLAVDYALQSVFEYVRLHADDPPLILVLGDHQAAEFIALDGRAEVPFHVIGPAHLVDPLGDVAPTQGLVPGDDVSAIPMDSMRDILLNAYGSLPGDEVGN